MCVFTVGIWKNEKKVLIFLVLLRKRLFRVFFSAIYVY